MPPPAAAFAAVGSDEVPVGAALPAGPDAALVGDVVEAEPPVPEALGWTVVPTGTDEDTNGGLVGLASGAHETALARPQNNSAMRAAPDDCHS